jgi:hypothetical protein
VGGIFEGGNAFRHSSFTVVAGFAFFYFLPLNIGQSFAFGSFTVMAGFALQAGLVGTVGEKGRFRRFGRINRRLQDNFRSTLVAAGGFPQ